MIPALSWTARPGAPFAHMPALKFRCPWLIKTPPGYSTLFLPPVNRFDAPFIPFSGIVESSIVYGLGLALMERMRKEVADRFGVTLSPEVEFLGLARMGT